MPELVEIAFVQNEYEGVMIQSLLEEAGIPSLQQQVGLSGPQLGYGFLNPGGGSRRVMVHPPNAERARALIAEAEDLPEPVDAEYPEYARGGREPRNYGVIGAYARSLFWSLVGLAVLVGVVMLLRLA